MYSKNKQICCKHIFNEESEILLVIRTPECFQFLCGASHDENSEPELLDINYIISRDKSLTNVMELRENHSIERNSVNEDWVLKFYNED